MTLYCVCVNLTALLRMIELRMNESCNMMILNENKSCKNEMNHVKMKMNHVKMKRNGLCNVLI